MGAEELQIYYDDLDKSYRTLSLFRKINTNTHTLMHAVSFRARSHGLSFRSPVV
jgi:hypothetical protein